MFHNKAASHCFTSQSTAHSKYFKKSQRKTADWTRLIFCFQKRKKSNKPAWCQQNQDTRCIEIQEKGKWEKNVALTQVPPGSHCHSVCWLYLHQVSSVLQGSCCSMPDVFSHFQHFYPYQGSSASLAEHSGWLTACRRNVDCTGSIGLSPNWISKAHFQRRFSHTWIFR